MNIFITIGMFIVWGIFDFLGQNKLFDEFDFLGKTEKKPSDIVWIVYYFLVTIIFCYSKYQRFNPGYNITYFLYYLRMVPLLWNRNGIRARSVAITFFYEEIEAVIASSLAIIVVLSGKTGIIPQVIDDVFAMLTSVMLYILIRILCYLKSSRRISIWLADVSVTDYIIMIIMVYLIGSFETDVCLGYHTIEHTRFIAILAMAFALVICLRIIFISEQKLSMSRVLNVMNAQMDKMTSYYRTLNDKDLQIREYRHDFKNHLSMIDSLVKNGQYDKAGEYIHDLYDGISKTAPSYDTGNFITDALLSAKADYGKASNIQISFDGVVPKNNVSDTDMVILFSNLLDNAIEACEKLDGMKTIIVTSLYRNGIWNLSITNPYSGAVRIEDDQIETTKENKELHGFGIRDIKSVARKYGGKVHLTFDDRSFTVIVMI
ncbi:MAG: GHKL domain-containing protein [Lachnospiraceae bacterium]|nr:GHKL domain-containing protein [Lachnospiraceae bacterium]